MKIVISDQLKLNTAISLAHKQKFFEALTIFAQVESYESVLNQIACLCQMEDVSFAIDLYRFAKQKYGETYAVYSDVAAFEDITETLLSFCEPNSRLAVSCDGKKRADKNLLIDINFYDQEEDEVIAPDFNYVGDEPLMDNPALASNNFYDVKSTQYFDSLRVNMERCYMQGDEKQAKKYAKRLLQLDTTHLPTLEAQISLILYTKKYKNGIVYAQRLADSEDFSNAAVCGAIDIVMYTDARKHAETLKKLMDKAVQIVDQLNLYDLEDFIYIATAHLRNREMAYKFAQTLFKDYNRTGLEALKMCASAFFNMGDWENAKNAAIILKNATPQDAFAQILCDYLKNRIAGDKLMMEVAPRAIRHYYIPVKLAAYAQSKLYTLLESKGNQATLGTQELFYLKTVIAWLRSLVLTDSRKEYYDTATFIRAVIRTFEPENLEEFAAFAKEQMTMVMCDQCVNEYLVAQLLQFGYQGRALVGLTDGSYYSLDFSQLTALEETFVFSFAICATLCKVKPLKYLNAYIDLTEAVALDANDRLLTHKVAYAMLCVCNKDFDKSLQSEFFADEEKDLYLKYRETQKKPS